MIHFDFEFVLVAAVFISGLIWLLDAVLFAAKRKAGAGSTTPPDPVLVEYSKSFFPVLQRIHYILPHS